eukprot:TRINITY_DN48616_c0_g1_i1.p1 TRINITY_DN48616_c0_g1~~TRINITY_DN48616_c0_g1_i1.p1  ORF type:complete len:384 (-),score=91.55 TRINITY_DN48616_c0_g1_i1:134-1261(-)
MSKPRKVAKRPAGEAFRWVPKGEDSAASSPDISLEEFRRSGWEPLPDKGSTSLKDYYFNSYARFGIHEDMLKDKVRTGSYMQAVYNSKHLFRGKVVLDIGAGTGILCLFAAKAGARQVIGIECSDIAGFAKCIAESNGFGDVITYVQGKVEEVELPVDKVDIIISEWMGYFLIYESMLDSVLFARDKWLREGGHMFPDRARIYMAAIEDAEYKEDKIGFWDHIRGFDFSPVQELVLQEPISDIVNDTALATAPCCVLELDLKKIKCSELDFVAPYSMRLQRKDFIHALVVWFDVSFEAAVPAVVLSTAPGQPATHWKQTVLYLSEPLVAHQGDVISGMLAVRKNKDNPRDLDVKLSYTLNGQVPHACTVQSFRVR